MLAGTIASGSNAKRHRIAELALQERVPLVMLLEGAGFRPGDRGHGRSPTDLLMQAQCSGSVPIAVGVLGASAGHGALIAPMSDFAVMTERRRSSPPVRRWCARRSARTSTRWISAARRWRSPSGLIHNLADDDRDALGPDPRATCPTSRRARGPIPSRSTATTDGHRAGARAAVDHPPRRTARSTTCSACSTSCSTTAHWFEVQPGFGRAVVCALAHLGGHPVAVVANQPSVLAGSIDADAADKAAHFMSVADAFHLPIVFLSDNPGVLPGTASERAGILRAGARMFAAQTLATHHQAARHLAQGVRLRLDGDGDERVRPSDRVVRVPRGDARGDGRHRQRHRLQGRRGHDGDAAPDGAGRVVPLGVGASASTS